MDAAAVGLSECVYRGRGDKRRFFLFFWSSWKCRESCFFLLLLLSTKTSIGKVHVASTLRKLQSPLPGGAVRTNSTTYTVGGQKVHTLQRPRLPSFLRIFPLVYLGVIKTRARTVEYGMECTDARVLCGGEGLRDVTVVCVGHETRARKNQSASCSVSI